MKFRFCGDQDAPDWILAEVSVLSKMSSIRVKLICKLVVAALLGNPMNNEKLRKLTTAERLNFTTGDVKAMVAALTFIIANAGKFDVDGVEVLPQELEQLGLPRDICRAICKSFIAVQGELTRHCNSSSLSLPRLKDVQWRVDYVVSSSALKDCSTPAVYLQLGTDKRTQETFEVDAEKFKVLFSDLKAIDRIFKQNEDQEAD